MKHAFIVVILLSILSSTGFGQNTIALNKGWNDIGSLCNGEPAAVLTTTPPGIIVSSFFGYNNAYFAATELQIGLGYWIKTSSAGSLTFTCNPPDPCGTLVVGYGTEVYHTALIGSQCWMTDNLNIGDRVDASTGQVDNGTMEKFCYNDDPANCDLYGGLYAWDEAMQYVTTAGTQGICPAGWHLPTDAEYATLSATVGGDGNALKAVGQGSGGGDGTNTSGFSALLAGYYVTGGGGYVNLSSVGEYWTSSENTLTDAQSVELGGTNGSILTGPVTKSFGSSIRCLQD